MECLPGKMVTSSILNKRDRQNTNICAFKRLVKFTSKCAHRAQECQGAASWGASVVSGCRTTKSKGHLHYVSFHAFIKYYRHSNAH